MYTPTRMVSGGAGLPVLNNKEVEISNTVCIPTQRCMTKLSGTQIVTSYDWITRYLYLQSKIAPLFTKMSLQNGHIYYYKSSGLILLQ